MRFRPLATVLGAGVAFAAMHGLLTPAAVDAASAGERLFLHGTSAQYTQDALLDPPAGEEGRAPAGVFADTKPPTGTTSKIGITAEPTGSPGLPIAPTFTLPFQGPLTTACVDVFVEGLPDGGNFMLYVAFGKGAPIESDVWTYPPGTLAQGSGIIRVTALLKMDSAFPMVEDATAFFYVSSTDLGPDTRPYALYYDSVEHPSNVTMNPTGECTPFAGGGGGAVPTGAPSAEPSASASAEPSAAPSAEPSPSSTGEPSPTQSPISDPSPTQPPPASCAPASPSPQPAGSESASAASESAAAVAPKLPPGGSATPSASAAPSESAEPSAEPSATASGGSGGGSDDACAAGSISLTSGATQITAGNTPTLSGLVRNFRGDAVDGVTVTIYTKGYGEARYSAAATAVTDSAGRFRLRVRPMKQTAFVAGVGDKRSPVLSMRVSTRVDITSPRASSTVANPVTFTGRLLPGYTRVPVGLGYLVNGRFVVLTQTRTTGTGTYSLSARLPRGTYAFVLFTSAHQGTDKGSRSVRLTVR